MATNQYIESVEDMIRSTETLLSDERQIALFRGQCDKWPLLPKVARKDPKKDTTVKEKEATKEFRRRLARERDIAAMEDWDLLVYAQHHGLSTRLLDWTTNPLFALWFACFEDNGTNDAFVYIFFAREDMLLDTSVHDDPFAIRQTRVVKPNYNSSRIRAQSGWFTAHAFAKKDHRFVDLHKNKSFGATVLMKGVRSHSKPKILQALDRLGVNEETVFPGPEGTARHVNWLHRADF